MIKFHNLAGVSAEQVHAWLEVIAADLRPGDRDEMRATSPLLTIGDPDPVLVLMVSIMQSEDAWIITDDGQPFCVFGAAPDCSGDGIVWMMGTTHMDDPRAKLAVGKATRPVVNLWLTIWPRVWNHIDARNTQSLQWLLWAGFEIEDVDLTHGREHRPFYLFSKTEGPRHL
ncbi:MAG TPA: hypothetical protein DEB60_07420 [Brevundimonas sp.]|nr:hypothetical protein [Brevundimonas sp.]